MKEPRHQFDRPNITININNNIGSNIGSNNVNDVPPTKTPNYGQSNRTLVTLLTLLVPLIPLITAAVKFFTASP